MSIKKEVQNFFLSLFFFSLCLILFLLATTLLKKKSEDNLLHIPKNASLVCIINADKVIEKGLFDLLLRSKDEDLLKLLQKNVSANRKSENNPLNGINLFSKVVYFEDKLNNNKITGLIFNLNDAAAFVATLNRNDRIGAASDNIGVLLFKAPNNTSDRLKALHYCQTIASNKTASAASKEIGKEDELFHFYFRSKNKLVSNFLVRSSKNALFIEGNSAMEASNLAKHPIRLSPKGLHVSSSLLPKSFNDSMQHFLKKLRINLPPIISFSINYDGCRIEQTEQGLAVLPSFDLILQFKKPLNVNTIFNEQLIERIPGASIEQRTVLIHNNVYYFKQLDEKSIYLGIQSNPTLARPQTNKIFFVKGNLTALTNIKADGIIGAFLEMIPLYKSGKILTDHIQSAEISIEKSENQGKIASKILFREGYFPLTELMRFGLIGQLLN